MSVQDIQPASTTRPTGDAEWTRITSYQTELDSYYKAIVGFSRRDVTEILMALAAFSARASEIRSTLVRNESRRGAAFRTRELDPFLQACEFQFKVFSRLQSVRQIEADLSRGGM